MAERSIAAVLKTVEGNTSGGSNPSLSAHSDLGRIRLGLMKKIGFLSFGHWSNHPAYKTRTAGDTLLQSIDLAVAAEEIGVDGAYFRVHHFAAQLASPFPLLSAIGAKTSKIEKIGRASCRERV